ncbi:LicD family protein [Parasphingorhabdus sp.]|uniref:LicD family protein n=1 Tax=Parasphingorhabdus sp. TaxID=2709688 RepID=UPI0032666936
MSAISQDDLHRLQKTILEIATYFDAFCKSHDISYYLMGGTALGAMRHGGFIPWDDDYDVFMDAENYKKFFDAASDSLDEDRFYLQRENTEEWPLFFSKLRLNDTIFLESDTAGRDMHHGIYIDIMCLNHAFSSKPLRYLQYFTARVLSTMALARRGYETTSPVKRLAMTIARAADIKPLRSLLLKFVRSRNQSESKMIGHFFGRAPFHATSFPKTYLGEARYVPFETEHLPVPSNVEAYLARRFGSDFMKPPSQQIRDQYPSHAVKVDFGPYQP